ncbi:hypothetical protein EUGRSUZ_H00291 [Eucalyptus grandis]|uniref:Uncharacterized protein n=2 Tax=Eucalyptus grandis TaxID=71139 RepID=A0ACC3JJJ0_EUCGR|nr:hypothetical protein EUGRSUZ_H00291 [Eucalyptus grandis]
MAKYSTVSPKMPITSSGRKSSKSSTMVNTVSSLDLWSLNHGLWYTIVAIYREKNHFFPPSPYCTNHFPPTFLLPKHLGK